MSQLLHCQARTLGSPNNLGRIACVVTGYQLADVERIFAGVDGIGTRFPLRVMGDINSDRPSLVF